MMNLRLRLFYLIGVLILSICLWNCRNADREGKELIIKYCGNCHKPPSPEDLPKHIWFSEVLPEMGARLGIYKNWYNPYNAMSWAEKNLLEQGNFYPKSPMLSEIEWNKLSKYILKMAPDTLEQIPVYNLDSINHNFEVKAISLDSRNLSLTTFIDFNEELGQLVIGNGFGELKTLSSAEDNRNLYKGVSSILGFEIKGDKEYVLEMGKIAPTELSLGNLYQIKNDIKTNLRKELHRPVSMIFEDINGDGIEEIIIAEYGHYTGRLGFLTKTINEDFEYFEILEVPGIMKVDLKDMDKDGLKDLIIMAAQGDEQVDILYQEEGLTFSRDVVLRFSSVYGSSWFEVIDFNGDGFSDILTVNGDNADYSKVLKPYHGMRIHLNDGNNNFEEKYFFPLNGATRVVARDFDKDGDIDIGVSCFFPDFEGNPEASFVYLECLDREKYSFALKSFEGAKDGRWLIMESEDYDQDGDEDIILGSFTYELTPVPQSILSKWNSESIDVLILENILK